MQKVVTGATGDGMIIIIKEGIVLEDSLDGVIIGIENRGSVYLLSEGGVAIREMPYKGDGDFLESLKAHLGNSPQERAYLFIPEKYKKYVGIGGCGKVCELCGCEENNTKV